ncbi:MAG: 2-aminoethylphosphonate--pyruvate transaminase [Candidatus Adiutrix sp.]|jgi:2-aminoethylphosphonate-pyruvate transaminase|nr:2-aminoethylphosphonate--pyruvate transaminase [Candidatus Adiutrix sp.]
MDETLIPENPYLLLTPGPLSSSKGVRAALLRDWCTWDGDYNEGVVQNIRRRLAGLMGPKAGDFTAVLMQGSGSFAVESVLGSVVPQAGRLLILTNGAYGQRMVRMAETLKLPHRALAWPETAALEPAVVDQALAEDESITQVALVHCETTTGILNPLPELTRVVKARGKTLIVDAMSSFGGLQFDAGDLDFLISSANKCLQGVPGFAFVIARRTELEKCRGLARSHCLDLYDQWREMEAAGKWRFTSPTHVVRAFLQALEELAAEGGPAVRQARYAENQRLLVEGMRALGFETLLPDSLQSPFITAFKYPGPDFDFLEFYRRVKARGFVLYPGKVSRADTFRIGSIGEVYPEDMRRLLAVIREIRGPA